MTVDIAKILLETGRLTPAEVETAQAHATESGSGIEEALTSLDVIGEDDIAAALGRYFEIPGLSLARLPRPEPRVTRLVPENVARERLVIPLEKAGETLILLMADPTDVAGIEVIRKGSGLEVQPVVASPATVRVALDTFYAPASRRLLDQALPFVGKLITKEAAEAYQALPVDRDGGLVTVAMAAPDEKHVRAIEMATGLQVKAVQAPWPEIERAIARIWSARPAPAPASPAPPAAAKPAAGPATPAAPAARPAPATPKAPVQSLGDLLGTGGGLAAGGAAPRPAATSGGALSLDLGGGTEPKPAAAAPAKPAAAAPAKPAAGGGALSLDLGLGSSSSAPPPPPAPAASTPPAAKTGNGSLSLDSLLGDAAAPPKKKGNGSTKPAELKAQALSLGDVEPAGAVPLDLPEGAEAPAPVEAEEADDGIALPDLSAGGGPDGPKTGLKVEATDLQRAREIATKKWGELDRRLAKLVPEKLARNYRVVVTGRLEKTLYVAFENVKDSFARETVEFVSGLRVEASEATSEEIAAGLEVLYTREADDIAQILEDLAGVGLDDVESREELDALSDMDAAAAAEAAPIVRLVTMVIDKALQARASDIHFEVYEDHLRIRYRIDGVLREVLRPPLQLRDPIISRLKILGRMDISERRLPQDGRLRMRKTREGQKKDIDFRISSIPTIHGEKVVMRILDKDRIKLDLRELGMESAPLEQFREAIHRPYGMVLVVGPSGCGKTNTLYSALADVNRPDVNIMTCEDPVEFSTMGLNQVQARESIGLNFATALRSFLRQDPNIILVGEVRDFETAEIAIKAALTGHMVLSTLHTNDAPACLNRLTNMGVEPFLIATSLHLVVAQRLVRVICDGCSTEDTSVSLDQLVQMGFTPEEARAFKPRKGAGCEKCEGTGYYGRTGIFEVLRVTDEMREMVLYNGSQLDIKQLAARQGMRTLRQAGLTKIAEGVTTCDEVIRETIG